MTRIAFIGLGVMGAPMAANLLAAGHEVTGYNRSRAAVDTLVEQGGRAAESAAAAARDAEIIVTMLPDGPDVEQVALGADGIYRHAMPGALHIDCSTIRPDAARRIARAALDAEIRMIDAPVSGGEAGAIEGSLSIMVGGKSSDFERARPILEVLGRTIVHVGGPGAGQTVKAANQLIVAGNIELLAEALVFLEASGVDTETALAALSGGLAGSTVMARKGPSMRKREFAPGFRLRLHHKDMGIFMAAARDLGVDMPLGSRVADLIADSLAQGRGDLDHGALLLQVERPAIP